MFVHQLIIFDIHTIKRCISYIVCLFKHIFRTPAIISVFITDMIAGLIKIFRIDSFSKQVFPKRITFCHRFSFNLFCSNVLSHINMDFTKPVQGYLIHFFL